MLQPTQLVFGSMAKIGHGSKYMFVRIMFALPKFCVSFFSPVFLWTKAPFLVNNKSHLPLLTGGFLCSTNVISSLFVWSIV